mmetsp:Transcript_51892/g.147903  ORF Transcript_51892/g.147903 Transcript_51892/m.147903 type:complete len:102 (-) Transcript_51892:789-1094(-)
MLASAFPALYLALPLLQFSKFGLAVAARAPSLPGARGHKRSPPAHLFIQESLQGRRQRVKALIITKNSKQAAHKMHGQTLMRVAPCANLQQRSTSPPSKCA